MALSLQNKDTEFKRFDWWYMFIMIIYMGMATPATSKLVGTLSGNPIPLLIPLYLTYRLYRRNAVSFDNKDFIYVAFFYFLWMGMSLFKWGIYATYEFSFYLYPILNIAIAYVQIKSYGRKLIPLYETVLVVLCKIAIVGWFISFFHFLDPVFRMFPKTYLGNSILYIYSWTDPTYTGHSIYHAIMRNSGCAWEPGRFAIMVVLGIFCNICRRGVTFRDNSNILWLWAALLSTFSTTGYVCAMALYLVSMVRGFNAKTVGMVLLFIPVAYYIYSLDFIGNKLSTKIEEAQSVDRLSDSFYWSGQLNREGEYKGSIDRFDAIVFEIMNIKEDPLLGYTNNFKHSYFYRHISTNHALANGLFSIISKYGVIFGILIFFCLFRSSFVMHSIYPDITKLGLIVTLMLSSLSYMTFSIPVFTAFWMFGIFYDRNT